MQKWLIGVGNSAGAAQNYNLTKYHSPLGYLTSETSEPMFQVIARDSYTLSKLYVRINSNTVNNSSTVSSRKNGVNGAQSVSIPATTTGAFEDNINTDSLVSGDLFNSERVTGGTSGFLRTSTIVYCLATATNTTPLLGSSRCTGYSGAATRYSPIMGYQGVTVTESIAQYIFRVASTLSNFRCYILDNSLSGASTVSSRKNGVNGAQSVSIPATTTGAFEDNINTDSIASGNLVNYQIVTGGLVGETLLESLLQLKSNSTGRQVGVANAEATTLSFGLTRYLTVEGNSQSFNATELLVQAETRTALQAKNMFVLISANTIDNGSTFTLRKNTANTGLSVSIPATTTGTFEDSDTVSFVLDDLINWGVVTGGTVGTMVINYIAFEQQQSIALWQSLATKMLAGVK